MLSNTIGFVCLFVKIDFAKLTLFYGGCGLEDGISNNLSTLVKMC